MITTAQSIINFLLYKEPLLNAVTVNMARFLRLVGDWVTDSKKENQSPPKISCT